VVDFRYWFDNVVGSSQLIASEGALRRKWVQKETGITSAYDPDELFEQLLGDLRLKDEVQRFKDDLIQLGAFDALNALTSALIEAEGLVRGDARFADPQTLLTSPEWAAVRHAAGGVIRLPAAKALKQEPPA
jgi:hypothetical protein